MSINMDKWIDSIQAIGRYTFLRSEALYETGLSEESAKKSLQRLANRKRIVKVKNTFYAIVPLEYVHAGSPPPSWFIDDLFRWMERPYYVGLLSAASLHGASHHQPQEFQIVTDKPIRSLQVGRVRITFIKNKDVTKTLIQDFKTSTGAMQVSTPEATAYDLVRYHKAAGQLENVVTVLKDLVPVMNAERLQEVVCNYGSLPVVQRLGYLLDTVQGQSLTNNLFKWVKRQSPRIVGLSSMQASSQGHKDPRWRVQVSEPIEVEP